MTCRLGLLQMDLSLPGVRSLKEKRRILLSLKDRIRDKFNASVSEVGMNDQHQRAVLAVVSVANDSAYLNGLLDKVLALVRSEHRASLVHHTIDIF